MLPFLCVFVLQRELDGADGFNAPCVYGSPKLPRNRESPLRSRGVCFTIHAAHAMGVEDRVGSLKPGKDADIAVFSGHPFHYLTQTAAVFIGGKRVE